LAIAWIVEMMAGTNHEATTRGEYLKERGLSEGELTNFRAKLRDEEVLTISDVVFILFREYNPTKVLSTEDDV
jgi:hypothetical protein